MIQTVEHLGLGPTNPIGGRSAKVHRPDIDGLRALAVLAVIGCDFKIALLKGGFVGIDVLLVIGGIPDLFYDRPKTIKGLLYLC